jgi:hypothetical protein
LIDLLAVQNCSPRRFFQRALRLCNSEQTLVRQLPKILQVASRGRVIMERSQNAASHNVLSLLRAFDDAHRATCKPARDSLMAQHERVVKAARLDASTAYGSAASRKAHAAWKAAEARFAESLASIIPEQVDGGRDEAAG